MRGRYGSGVRIVVARCTVNYVGRLTAHLPEAIRVIMVKADGSVLIHSDGGSYKPLNWMSPPCVTKVLPAKFDTDESTWVVENKAGEQLLITIHETLSESEHALGIAMRVEVIFHPAPRRTPQLLGKRIVRR